MASRTVELFTDHELGTEASFLFCPSQMLQYLALSKIINALGLPQEPFMDRSALHPQQQVLNLSLHGDL